MRQTLTHGPGRLVAAFRLAGGPTGSVARAGSPVMAARQEAVKRADGKDRTAVRVSIVRTSQNLIPPASIG